MYDKYRRRHRFNFDIIPNRLIYKRHIIPMTLKDNRYIVRGIDIITLSDIVVGLQINGSHPNADSNGMFCLPSFIKRQFDNNITTALICIIKTFNLDDCYFTPWDAIEKG